MHCGAEKCWKIASPRRTPVAVRKTRPNGDSWEADGNTKWEHEQQEHINNVLTRRNLKLSACRNQKFGAPVYK